MIDTIRASWRRITRAPAGERFSRYHDYRQQQPQQRWRRPLRLAVGMLAIVIGLIMMPAPGPGMLVIAAGAAVLAGESARFAHFLDRTEQRLRRRFGR